MPAAIMAGLALDCDLIASILNPNSAFSATPVTKLKSQANSYWFLTHSSGEWPVVRALQQNSGAKGQPVSSSESTGGGHGESSSKPPQGTRGVGERRGTRAGPCEEP